MSYLKTVAAAVRAARPGPAEANQPAAAQSKREIMAAVFADPRLTTPGLRGFAFQSASQSTGMTADQIVARTLKLFDPSAYTSREPSANELALLAKIEARDAIEGGDPLAGSEPPAMTPERVQAGWNVALDNAISAKSWWIR